MCPTRRTRCAVFLAICTIANGLAIAQSPDVNEASRIALSGNATAAALHTLLGARRRLVAPQCQQILTEFADEHGQTLASALRASGYTAQEHFDLLYLAEGNVTTQCLGGKRLAFTSPHSRVIFICGQVFEPYVRQNPIGAEILLIHEFLHTLGLGEDPPSTSQITDRVAARCGDVHDQIDITVNLVDPEGSFAAVRARAQVIAAGIYEQAGITVAWADELPPPPRALTLMVVPSASAPAHLADEAMGVAPSPGDGTRGSTAYVFSDRVTSFAASGQLHLASVLACAMAHEVGHLLLPAGAHTRDGIMRDRWSPRLFPPNVAGVPGFTPRQARLLRLRAASR